METKEISLTENETKKLKIILDDLEAEVYYQFQKRSGGFAKADVTSYDEDFIDIELIYGIQDGNEDVTYSEQLLIDRHSMEIMD